MTPLESKLNVFKMCITVRTLLLSMELNKKCLISVKDTFNGIDCGIVFTLPKRQYICIISVNSTIDLSGNKEWVDFEAIFSSDKVFILHFI